MKSSDIHIRAISQDMPQPWIIKIHLKITYIKFHSNFQGVNELIGLIFLQDHSDTGRLLSKDNVDQEALMRYAREAADVSTRHRLPQLDYAHNHYGQPDVAMFDFTSIYAAENSSRVMERNGYKLLEGLVGDSLLEVGLGKHSSAWCLTLNILRPEPNAWMLFCTQTVNCFFLTENVAVSVKTSLKFVPKAIIDESALVQALAWLWTGAKPVPEQMMI